MKQDNEKRLHEVMARLDKTFKPKLNEEFGAGTDDPTKEEMVGFLTNKFQGMVDPMETDANNFDIESAIYWFGNDYHGGQSSNLYSALSTSQFRPGPMHKSIEDEESEIATMMYQELVDKYGGQEEVNTDKSQWMGMSMNEKDDNWIQKAVDPAHKGYCTPMTKDTCTPRRKALAKRFKAGIEDESIMEAIVGDDREVFRIMVEKLKASMDKLFAEEHFDIIDTLYRIIVERKKPIANAPQINEDISVSAGVHPVDISYNVYKDVMALINNKITDDVWAGGAENALKYYDKVIDGIRDALYQDMGDSVNPNAGAAPDEMV